MKKWLKYSLLIIIVLFIGLYFFVQNFKKSALPDYNQNIKIEGLTDKVTVYRDAYGTPHIYAKNKADLYKVVGYVTAQDRLWEMDLLRRVTQGRLSEIFGEKTVDTDEFLRKLRIPLYSKKLLPTLKDETRKPLEYFADGVNQYIKDHKDNLPFEFKILGYTPENWKPEHSLNLVGYMAWNLELGYKMEVVINQLKSKISPEKYKLLFPDYKRNNTYAYPSFKFNDSIQLDNKLVAVLEQISNISPDIFNGSNNWVVAGKKSTTGKPIFSNDMHLGLNVPGIWSRMHQNIEGKLNVTGVTLPGSPFIVAGHNDKIAWGMTNVMLDGADFYVETINPNNKSQYKFNGKWRDMEVKKEKIFVKDKEKPVERTLYFTHRGPVISKFGNIKTQPVSMHWIGNEESREIESLYYLNRAKNWEDFTQAIKGFNSVSQNIAYADVEGNIGLHLAGKIPKRTAPGYLFFPGDTDKYDWKGFVPFDSLPYEYNPKRGFVSSANNKSLSDDNFPYYITEWYDLPYRIKRIRQMLTAKEKLSTEDFRQMLYDHHSAQADELKPVLIKYLSKANLNTKEKKAFEILKKWDNVYGVNQSAPLIFEQTLIEFTHNTASDEMGETLFKSFNGSLLFSKYLLQNVILNEDDTWCDDVNTKEKETFAMMLEKSFKQAVAKIEKDYGNIEDVKWGKVHHLYLEHPIGKVKILNWALNLNRKFEAPGGSNTVNPFTFSYETPYDSEFGASEKHIFSAENWDKSYSILPTGISGIPASKHYLDQAEKYVKGEVLPDYFSKNEVEKHTKYKSVFGN